jgi:uncharacterized protein
MDYPRPTRRVFSFRSDSSQRSWLPTADIAAYAAARGSERLHARLLAHPQFGPVIVDWQRHGAVSRRAKWAATWTMLACAVVLLLVMPLFAAHRWWMTALPLVCMTVVAAWLWYRPEPPAR